MTQQSSPHVVNDRKPDAEISAQFIERWSPRAFAEREVPAALLDAVLEAGRWAPSASNQQPWRVVVAQTEADKHDFYTFIADTNLEWCKKAPILLLLLSSTINDNGKTNHYHAFDTGTAWGYMALEARAHGLITHAMGGFNRDKAREVLNVPEELMPQAVIALGYQDDPATLPQELQEREKPSGRKPRAAWVQEGKYPARAQ